MWLIPKEQDVRCLRDLVSELASSAGKEPFQLHITLLRDVECFGLSGSRLLRLVAAQAHPIHLAPRALVIDDRDRCALDFERTPELEETLVPALKSGCEDAIGSLRPHMSLNYWNLDPVWVSAIHEMFSDQLAARVIRFDRVALYCTDGRPHEWHEVDSCPLGPDSPI